MSRAFLFILFLPSLAFAQSGTQGNSGIKGNSGLQAGAAHPTALAISPLAQSQTVGNSVGYTATATFSNGQTFNVTQFSGWSVNNTAILSPLGLTTGTPPVENINCLAAGSGSVTATYSGFTASTTLTCTSVVPPPPTLVSIALTPTNPSASVGQIQGFRALGTYSDNSTQDVTAASVWVSNDTLVATLGTLTTQQNFNCIRGGTSTISATMGAVSGSTTLTCNAVLTSITVNPATAAILVGQTQNFTATGTYNDGSTQNVTLQATWSSSASAVASVGATVTNPEVVVGNSAGSATITAAVGSVSGTATITVSNVGPPPPTLASIAIAPSAPTINTGSTVGLIATCTYSDSSTRDCTLKEPINNTTTVWSSGTPAVATVASPVVDPEIVSGVSAGTSTITATIGAVHGTATVTVQTPTPTLSSVTIGPATPTVTVGSNIGFTATCHYSDSSTQDCTLSDPLHATTTVWTSSATAVATVASPVVDPETASCIAVGTSTVNAQIGAVGGNTVLTCQAVTPPSIGNDAYESAGNVCSFGATDSFATLPQTCYYTNPSALPSPGTLRSGLSTNALFNAAATAAACGDILEIPQGSALSNITLPLKSCDANHYITIRTSGFASLPAYGKRVTPCYAGTAFLPGRPGFNCVSTTNVMAKITTTNTQPALTVTSGGAYWRVFGLEVTRNSGTGTVSKLIEIAGTNHLVLDHIWCHGDETGDETTQCTGLTNTNFIASIDSFYTDFYCISAVGTCTDAHAIGGGTNATIGCSDATYKIVDNFLEAAAQSFLLGGGQASCTPADIEFRLNYLFKPMIWNPACTAASCGVAYNGGFQGGNPVLVKNLLEFKNAQRVLVEGNVMQNVWAGFSQPGTAVLITPKNQAVGTSNVCPLCEVLDVTVRYNYITTMASPITKANGTSDAGGSPLAGMRYSIHDNVGDNMLYPACYKCGGTSADAQTLTASTAVLKQVNDRHNTWVPNVAPITRFAGDFAVSGPLASSGNQMTQVNFLDDLLPPAITGISNPSDQCSVTPITNCACNQKTPTQILTACFSTYQFGGNALVGSTASGWPGTNCFGENKLSNIFVNYNNGVMIPGGDFHVKTTSPCHNAATDGTDPGANINTLLNRIQGVTTF